MLACLPYTVQYMVNWYDLASHLCAQKLQVIANCYRVWKGLVLAAFFNLQSKLYYELMGNFMGKGDKESFALGLSVAGLPFHLVSTPVGSIGWNQGSFGYGLVPACQSVLVACRLCMMVTSTYFGCQVSNKFMSLPYDLLQQLPTKLSICLL